MLPLLPGVLAAFNAGAGINTTGSQWLFASQNNKIGKTNFTMPTGKTRAIQRLPGTFNKDTDLAAIKANFAHWGVRASSTYVLKNAGSFTVTDVYLEIGGATYPLMAAGSLVVDSAAYMYSTGAILPSAISNTVFPKGTDYWVRIQMDAAVGTTIPETCVVSDTLGTDVHSTGQVLVYDPANHIEQVGSTGTLTTPTGATVRSQGLGFIGFTGLFVDQTKPSVMSFGDSIVDFGLGAKVLGWGLAGQDSCIAGIVVGVISLELVDHVMAFRSSTPADFAFITSLARHVNCVVEELGTNDISAGGKSAATIYSNLQTLYNDFRTVSGVEKIVRTKLLPGTYDGIRITALSNVGTTVTATVPSTANLVNGATYFITVSGGTNWAPASNSAAITVLNGTQFSYTAAGTPTGTPSTMPNSTTRIRDDFRSLCQEIKTGWGSGEARDQLHTLLTTALSSGVIDAFPDTLTPVAYANDNHFWGFNGTGGNGSGTANLTTDDGVHPSSNGQTLAAVPAFNAITALPAFRTRNVA